jgi:NAD(P)-dependent dehydrogenase (short-subunit alcohol dehydrogenase family)
VGPNIRREPQGLLSHDETRHPNRGKARRRLDYQHFPVVGIRYTGVPYSTYYATKAAMIHLTRTTAVRSTRQNTFG